MAFKNRTESAELKILRMLNARMELPPDEKQHYLNLKKGFEGEVKFDSLVEFMSGKFYILNDLLLEVNNTKFQIDSTIITQDSIFPFEVKNYSGDYYYHDDNFYGYPSKKNIGNPLHQLNRSKTLLGQFLQKNGFHLPVEGQVVFINPEFFLYQAPLSEPIVFHSQLNSLLGCLNAKPSKLGSGHRKLAELLLKSHFTLSPYEQLPPYEFNRLRKGPACGACESFSLNVGKKKLVCNDCGHTETIESAVLRSVEELRLLFPGMRITTNLFYEWWNGMMSIKTIGKILKYHYDTVGYGQWTYYQ